jgi:hypothetical protein
MILPDFAQYRKCIYAILLPWQDEWERCRFEQQKRFGDKFGNMCRP